ncbi:MAG: hypothetical protein WAS21_28020 [Geminicoccaceae bacterium]
MADEQQAGAIDQISEPPSWGGQIFWSALVVGAALAVGGLLCLGYASISSTVALLVLCSGLGIIFGAFGSTATIHYKGVVVAGVAAVAIVLLWFVDSLIQDDFVQGEIDGDITGSQIHIRGDRVYLGAVNDGRFEFIVVGKEIKRSRLEATFYFPPDEDGRGEEEMIFECIEKKKLEPFLGSGRLIQWRFDREHGELRTDDGELVSLIGPCPARSAGTPAAWNDWHILPSALAAEPEATDIDQSLQDLRSGSTSVRRDARQSLAAQGPAITKPLLAELRRDPDSYRTRLGVVVALTEMLREHKAQAAEIAAQLDDDDLALLTDAAGDPDRTVRVYASEFLFDLADPRTVPLALERLGDAGDNERFNLILVLKGTYPRLQPETKRQVDVELTGLRGAVGHKTQELIDSFVVG